VGLIGAAVGGSLFDLFQIDLSLGELVAAFVGSLIFLAGVRLLGERSR
jgi:uncharacterized membrane protein YeaQ/YmgE (transglycosylase-associated protein family)